jgi:hypothetical protein
VDAERQGYVHEVELAFADGTDHAAPGAAVTVALCANDGPCRWPHHNVLDRDGSLGRLRTVFVAFPGEEGLVRDRIDEALGNANGWTVVATGIRKLTSDEKLFAERLITALPR